jgi:dimethylhistidine N-methyltransferase
VKDLELEILNGLLSNEKLIPTRYLYDDQGSKLFQQIMALPEYYLTKAEYEILSQQADQILESLPFSDVPFQIIELGAGDGSKTKALLKEFLAEGADFTYEPIDISLHALKALEENLKRDIPDLKIQTGHGDYFEILENFSKSPEPMLVLFLGSNIGNYSEERAREILRKIRSLMHEGDALLLGADLQKNPKIIQSAYDDPYGITKRFNMNLLSRMNRELGANFHPDHFDFYCYYDLKSGVVNSYLVSLRKHEVWIKAFNRSIPFGYGETIFTECSRKFTLDQLKDWSEDAGFTLDQNFLDCKHFFCDSLWRS